MTEHESATTASPAASEQPTPQPATPSPPDPSLVARSNFPPINIDDPEPTAPHLSALPPLPRSIELRAAERWRAQVMQTAGKLGESDPAIAAALSAQATMADGLEALEVARQTRHPSKTAAQHLQAVRSGYDQLLKEGARKFDAAMAAIDARERDLDREVETRTALTPSADASEIRQTLQRMTEKERAAVMDAALKNGDKAVLSAVFSGRQMTTGVNETLKRSFQRRYEESMYPGLHGLRAGIKQARDLTVKAFDDLSDLDDKVLGSTQALDEFQRQVQAADTAWFALSRFTGA